MSDPSHSEDAPQGQSAYRQLLSDISTGILSPGTRLREAELADRLGISRTPVREAIRRLETDGLVTHLPRQGAAIRTMDYAEIMELYEMRAVLEGTAARMAARAASDIELGELAALNAALSKVEGVEAYDLNRQFHLTLLDAAKNRFLLKSMNALKKTLLILGPSTLNETDRVQKAVAEHSRILDGLRVRDGDRAEAEMRAHIEAAHRVRLRVLRNRERPSEEG